MPQTSKEEPKYEFVQFKTADIRLKCPIHGTVGVQNAYDPLLKIMTAISCAKCPTLTKDFRQWLSAHDRQLLTEAFAAVRPEDKPILGIKLDEPSLSIERQRRRNYNTALSDLDTNTAKYMEELE